MSTRESTSKLEKVIQIDEEKVQAHLGEIVRGTVEETLNSLLDAEADQLCKAKRYERTASRLDTRAGTYNRSLETKAGKVTLRMPKLRKLPFERECPDFCVTGHSLHSSTGGALWPGRRASATERSMLCWTSC